MRGAYGDDGMDMVWDGDPNPDMPETLPRLLECGLATGLVGRFGAPCFERLVEELEFESVGGVVVPVPKLEFNVEDECVRGTGGTGSLSLEFVLVLFSVLKLLRDLLRRSLRKAGAMVVTIGSKSKYQRLCGRIACETQLNW
jgi:hypothetical protein